MGSLFSAKYKALSLERVAERNYDASTLLRFVAITLIVAAHLDAYDYGGGGAYLLMVIVGFNIASFKLNKVIRTGSVFPVMLMILKVAVPTILYTAVLHLVFGPFTWQNLLLIGNFFTEKNTNGFGYWFIEVYVQIQLALMLLLAFPFVRGVISKDIRLSSYVLVALSSALMMICMSVWDTSDYYNRLPWLLMWTLAFGFAARFADFLSDKIIFFSTFVLVSYFFLGELNWYMIASYAVLILNPPITLPGLIGKLIHYIAAGSLFIYLTHFQVATVVSKVVGDSPWVSAAAALVIGAFLFHIYNRVINKTLTAYLRGKGYVV